jgi:glycosyltransferase involved in cell wall biosynthesis
MKKKILIKGPALSLSGYGEQARFALRSLREHQDKFDIFLQNIPWGKTGHMVEASEEKRWMDFLIAKTEQFKQQGGQFDISVQVTIPNEFEKIAPVNIGYTAGIETTKISPQWIEKSRLMDKLIVVSNHSKDIFNTTEYKLQNNQTGEIIDFKNTTPVEVVHFPVKKITTTELDLQLQTDFNFLTVAQWGPRKNVEATIISFLKEFKDEQNVGLVLKINFAKNSTADRFACEKRIEAIKRTVPGTKCKVYLVHGNMTDNEVQGLYTHPKIKAIVSTTHGEGFGLPLFEAACNGLPVIAPKWSGHVDFLMAPVKEDGKVRMRNHFTTIDFDLAMVNKEAVWDGVVQADSQWCYVKEHSVMDSMRKVFKSHGAALAQARKLQQYVLEDLKLDKQREKMFDVFKDYVQNQNEVDSILLSSDVMEF